MTKHNYNIAEHSVVIISNVETIDVDATLTSFQPFRCEADAAADTHLFTMTIEPSIADDPALREIGDFDTGNGHIKVDKNDATGAYRFLIRDIKEKPAALMSANSDFSDCHCTLLCEKPELQRFALNNALMLAYAFSGAPQQTLLIHASCVKLGEYAYAFIAKSGTGKSTQVSNWLKYIPDTELLNDDNPIVRVKADGVYIYGSPWSGKTPCYRNIRARLGALTRIVRDQTNFVVKEQTVQAFASVLPSCSTMMWDKRIYRSLIDTITAIIGQVSVYSLHCLPDRESAEVCHAEIAIKDESQQTNTQ